MTSSLYLNINYGGMGVVQSVIIIVCVGNVRNMVMPLPGHVLPPTPKIHWALTGFGYNRKPQAKLSSLTINLSSASAYVQGLLIVICRPIHCQIRSVSENEPRGYGYLRYVQRPSSVNCRPDTLSDTNQEFPLRYGYLRCVQRRIKCES